MTTAAARPWAVRLLVTLGALAIYAAGLWIPVPGVDTSAVQAATSLGRARLSIFALGVTPLLSAMFLGELARLVVSPLDRLARDPARSARYARWVLAGGLAFAFYQGVRVAEAYEGLRDLVPEPGVAFRVGATVAFVGATALLAGLARFVTVHGLVDGFWLLFLAPSLDAGARKAVLIFEYIREGAFSPGGFVVQAVFGLLAAFALAATGGSRAGAAPDNIWPAILGFYVARLLFGLLLAAGVGAAGATPFLILMTGALVFFIGARRGAPWPTLLAQIFTLVGAQLLQLALQAPLVVDAVWLIVATELARQLRASVAR